MKPILCLCIYIVAGISIYAQIDTMGEENSVLFRKDSWSFRDSLLEKISMPLWKYSLSASLSSNRTSTDKMALNPGYNYYFKNFLLPNKKLHDVSLPTRDASLLKDSLSKKEPVFLSKYVLLASLPNDSAIINKEKLFFYPARHHNKNSFLRKEQWQETVRWVGYNIFSNIGYKNNFIYTFPQ